VSRLLGVDHGSRRIGLAVGDLETRIAFARPALRPRKGGGEATEVARMARVEGASRVVLGLPRNMDGSEGAQAAAARRFGDALAAAGLEVVYVDERLSTWQARSDLESAGRATTRRSGEVDSAAAAVILQDYLDSLPQPPAQEAE
jgi:putative Holliday junction resolvase